MDIIEATMELGTRLRNDCNWVGTDGLKIIVYVESIKDLKNPNIPNYHRNFGVYVKLGSIPNIKYTNRNDNQIL